jgi:uncharacterized protein YegP (UPF0339 family)
MTPYYRITNDRDGYRARFYGANGELVWWTEGYTSLAAAHNAISLIRAHAASAPLR